MKVFNKTKDALVSDNVLVLKTFREKSNGMRIFKEPRAVYFETRWRTCPVPNSEHKNVKEKTEHFLRNMIQPIVDFPPFWCGVHTFGMKFPIDVVVLDEGGVVRAIKRDIKPNRCFFWNPKHRRVLELPTGCLIELFDQLEIF